MGSEFFYTENGKRKDAELHEPILAEGDHAAAEEVSRKIMRELGLDPTTLLGDEKK